MSVYTYILIFGDGYKLFAPDDLQSLLHGMLKIKKETLIAGYEIAFVIGISWFLNLH